MVRFPFEPGTHRVSFREVTPGTGLLFFFRSKPMAFDVSEISIWNPPLSTPTESSAFEGGLGKTFSIGDLSTIPRHRWRRTEYEVSANYFHCFIGSLKTARWDRCAGTGARKSCARKTRLVPGRCQSVVSSCARETTRLLHELFLFYSMRISLDNLDSRCNRHHRKMQIIFRVREEAKFLLATISCEY